MIPGCQTRAWRFALQYRRLHSDHQREPHGARERLRGTGHPVGRGRGLPRRTTSWRLRCCLRRRVLLPQILENVISVRLIHVAFGCDRLNQCRCRRFGTGGLHRQFDLIQRGSDWPPADPRPENVKTVSDRLGHSSIAITMDLYAHGSSEARQKAANSLTDLFPAADEGGGRRAAEGE